MRRSATSDHGQEFCRVRRLASTSTNNKDQSVGEIGHGMHVELNNQKVGPPVVCFGRRREWNCNTLYTNIIGWTRRQVLGMDAWASYGDALEQERIGKEAAVLQQRSRVVASSGRALYVSLRWTLGISQSFHAEAEVSTSSCVGGWSVVSSSCSIQELVSMCFLCHRVKYWYDTRPVC